MYSVEVYASRVKPRYFWSFFRLSGVKLGVGHEL